MSPDERFTFAEKVLREVHKKWCDGLDCEICAYFKPVEPQPKIQNIFHAHLDECEHCREHPFRLCDVGASALRREAAGNP